MLQSAPMTRLYPLPILSVSLVLLLAGCGDSDSTATSSTTASLGCTNGTLDGSVTHVDLALAGNTRSYELHVPTGYDGSSPLPLVLNFHGFTSNGAQQRLYTRMDDTADEHGFIVAYPNGLDSSWNAGVCCGRSSVDDVDDVGFALTVIDDIGERGCIDLTRVYATGMSNGGFMSHRLACEASDVIAAIGPVSGVLGIDPSACNPTRPVPMIHFHGTEDPLIFYEGGGLVSSMSVPDSTDIWSDRNGCSGEPEVTLSQGMVTCEGLDQCGGDASVTLCTIAGGGHCWPGIPCATIEGVDLGVSTTDINANEVMWELFSTVKLP